MTYWLEPMQVPPRAEMAQRLRSLDPLAILKLRAMGNRGARVGCDCELCETWRTIYVRNHDPGDEDPYA